MPRAVLLRCPICDSVRAFEGTRNERSKPELYPPVKEHLRSHGLDESKAAIRKHQIIDDADELIVAADDRSRLPVSGWQSRSATWLPESVPPETTPDATRSRPHAEK